jgi:dienelactone hydrolase
MVTMVSTLTPVPVTVPVDGVSLRGDLAVPDGAPAVVVFAHGSGSSRLSPRNTRVSSTLRERGLGTFLFDLLTREEDRDRGTRFEIDLLTNRLIAATAWLRTREEVGELPLCYFGSSTGAAAALRASTRVWGVASVVSRGGRVDLAADVFDHVTAPTLLIVGGADDWVLARNREAAAALPGEVSLEVIEGAGHLFEGPGELERVAALAGDWFLAHA